MTSNELLPKQRDRAGRRAATRHRITYRAPTLNRAMASITDQLGRRSFLGAIGKGGIAIGLGLAGSTLVASRSNASGSCSGGACGPSPLCPAAQCSSGQCYRLGGSANRNYNTLFCGTSTNCWNEGPYGSSCANPGTWRCCDCCAISGAGSICTNGPSCTGTFRACICRKKI